MEGLSEREISPAKSKNKYFFTHTVWAIRYEPYYFFYKSNLIPAYFLCMTSRLDFFSFWVVFEDFIIKELIDESADSPNKSDSASEFIQLLPDSISFISKIIQKSCKNEWI